MAEAMTYNSLIEDVVNYSERSDQPFTLQIPRLIMMAENRLASEVKGLGHVRYATGELVPGEAVLVKPTRWRETTSLFLNIGGRAHFLNQRSYTFCRSYWPEASERSEPEYYADYDYEHMLVAPTPDKVYPFELAYFERPLPLSEENQTNWTTRYAPQLLLYATLLEAQPFLKRSERIAEFQALYDRAVAAVGTESQRRMGGDQSLQRTV